MKIADAYSLSKITAILTRVVEEQHIWRQSQEQKYARRPSFPSTIQETQLFAWKGNYTFATVVRLFTHIVNSTVE